MSSEDEDHTHTKDDVMKFLDSHHDKDRVLEAKKAWGNIIRGSIVPNKRNQAQNSDMILEQEY